MEFVYCVTYLGLAGLLSHFIGEAIPRKWLDPQSFPYRPMGWEKQGKLYLQLGIRKWKDKVPDMSKVLPDMLPKRLSARNKGAEAAALVEETCVAELTHGILCLAGIGCVFLWPGPGGWAMAALWAAGNLPFILIQRYNRPRLAKLAGRALNESPNIEKGALRHAGTNIDL